MVFLAQSSPGCRSTRSLQIKKATVMLVVGNSVAPSSALPQSQIEQALPLLSHGRKIQMPVFVK
jgi:hypothetical protein